LCILGMGHRFLRRLAAGRHHAPRTELVVGSGPRSSTRCSERAVEADDR
jgi:hypothetical protein